MITITNPTFLLIIFSYFLGSIPGAIVICKILKLKDPRHYGSKNPGATNIFRNIGYKSAIFVMLFDTLKGAIAIWIGIFYKINPIYLNIITISVCIGHMYPIFFQFQGGKGVATAFGSLTVTNPDFFYITIGTWILLVLLFRYVSLGSIITATIIPIYSWYTNNPALYYIILLSLLIIIRHTNNIKRLWNNQEKKIKLSLN